MCEGRAKVNHGDKLLIPLFYFEGIENHLALEGDEVKSQFQLKGSFLTEKVLEREREFYIIEKREKRINLPPVTKFLQ